jgi:hypothetical protein
VLEPGDDDDDDAFAASAYWRLGQAEAEVMIPYLSS